MTNVNTLKSSKPKDNNRRKVNIIFILTPLIITFIIVFIGYLLRSSTVEGKVISSGDNKIILNNVLIRIDNKKELLNNFDGSYTISGLTGKHVLEFKKSGYTNLNKEINLTSGNKIILDISLDPISAISKSNNNFIALSLDSHEIYTSYNKTDNFSDLIRIDEKIYYINNKTNQINIINNSTGALINKIDFPSEFVNSKLIVSGLKDKIYLVGINSIGIVDLKTEKFINKNLNINSKIKNLIINKIDNRAFLADENNYIYSFNINDYSIYLIRNEVLTLNKTVFYRNNLISLKNMGFYSLDIYNPNQNPSNYNTQFNPENIVTTRSEKIYISSGKNLYLINPETGNIYKTIDTGINIINMKVSPQDDNIYISDNTEKIYIFDTQKDEISKDFVTFKTPVKEVFFPE